MSFCFSTTFCFFLRAPTCAKLLVRYLLACTSSHLCLSRGVFIRCSATPIIWQLSTVNHYWKESSYRLVWLSPLKLRSKVTAVKPAHSKTTSVKLKRVNRNSTTYFPLVSHKVELFFRTSFLDLVRWCCCYWPLMLLLLVCLFSSFSPPNSKTEINLLMLRFLATWRLGATQKLEWT